MEMAGERRDTSGEPYEGVGRDETEMSVEGRDELDSAEGVALAPRESFSGLVRDIVEKEKFSVRDAQDVNLVMDAFGRRASHLADHFSSIEQHTLEVLITLKHPEKRMTREWDAEFKLLTERKDKTDPEGMLSPEEKDLLSAFEKLNTVAPFLPDTPSAPKDFSKLATGWDTEVEASIKAAEEKSKLTRQEIVLIRDWNDGDFMGTGLSTEKWMALGDFDKRNFTQGFVRDKRRQKVAGDVAAESDNLTIAQALETLALNIELIHKDVRGSSAIQEEVARVYLGALEAVPAKSLKREVVRLGRRLKRGLDVSLSKASDTEKAIALGGAVVLLGALLFSKENAYAKAIRKFSLGGVVGVAAFVALDMGSGALFKGNRLSEKGAEALRLVGLGVSDNFYKVFAGQAEGGTEEAKRKHVENIDIFAGYAGDMKFSDLLERYKMVEGNSERILELPGFTDDGFIGDTKLNHSNIAYEAMYLVYKRYGTDIDNWDAMHPHGPKLATFTFLKLVTELVINDPVYEVPKETMATLINGAADLGRKAVGLGEVALDRLGEALDRKKAKLREYLGSKAMFGGDDGVTEYGKELDVSRTESVIILPGGVQTTFDFIPDQKKQDKSPGEGTSGFRLARVDRTMKEFYFDENNPDDIQAFAKQLIIDTGKKRVTQPRDDAEKQALELFNGISSQLEWNLAAHKWMLPGMKLGGGEYRIGEFTLSIEPSIESFFVNCYNLDEGTFGFNFFKLDEYFADPEHAPSYNLDRLQKEVAKDNLKQFVIDSFPAFPFTKDEFEITNWDAIVSTADLRPQFIEGRVTGVTTSLVFRGVPLANDHFDFGYVETITPKQLQDAYTHKLERTVTKLKRLGREMPEDWRSHWKRFFKLDFAGPFDERQWDLSVDQKRDQIRQMIDAEGTDGELLISDDLDSSQRDLVSGYMRDLEEVAESMDKSIHLKEKTDQTDFERQLRRLEGLALSGTQRAEYDYLRVQTENNFNFENENAKYAMLGLFVELTNDAAATDASGDQNSKAYIAYISQSLINHFYKQAAHRTGQRVREVDITALRSQIETARTRATGSIQPSGVMEGLNEWPTFEQYKANLVQYQFSTSVHMLERSWLEYTDLVTKNVFDTFRWRGASGYLDYNTEPAIRKEIANLPFGIGFDASKKWGGIHGEFSFDKMGSPLLQDLLAWGVSPSKWDLLLRPIDIMGGDVQAMIDSISYPALLRGRDDFKRQLAIETEDFVRNKIGGISASTSEADLKKLYEEYDLMIRGGVGDEGLWEAYLKPELIGKGDLTRPGGGIEAPVQSSNIQAAEALVKSTYSGAEIIPGRSAESTGIPPVVIVYFRDGGKTWKVAYNTVDKKLGTREVVKSGGTPPENPGGNIEADAKVKVKSDFSDAANIGTKVVRGKVSVTYTRGTQKYRTTYDPSTKTLSRPVPI